MYLRDGKLPSDGMHEECGVFGVYSTETRDVAHTVYYGLYALQHRGQESCGIAVAYANQIQYHKGMGLVPEVFAGGNLDSLPEGDIAIGHVRYSTTGSSSLLNAQPVVFTGKCGKMALAHNGNLTNAGSLREELIRDNAVFQTSIDSEVMALLINRYSDGDIVKGVIEACGRFCGSFALVVMTADKLIAVRDPYGIRPLVLGRLLDDTIVASESCAIDAMGATFVRDVKPGEVVVIDSSGEKSYFLERKDRTAACIFEYVYFARPDSVIDGCCVYEARKEAGRILARTCKIDADIVSGVPDSAVVAARGYSEVSGGAGKEPLRRTDLHPARPGDAREQRQPENERAALQRLRQADHPRRRLHRPRDDQPPHRADAARRRRERGAHDGLLADRAEPVFPRHRYAVALAADRRGPLGRRDLRVYRGGFPALSHGRPPERGVRQL